MPVLFSLIVLRLVDTKHIDLMKSEHKSLIDGILRGSAGVVAKINYLFCFLNQVHSREQVSTLHSFSKF